MIEQVKTRLATLRRGEVPAGYRRTKVGVFPQEWQLSRIQNCLSLAERPINMHDEEIYELVTVRRANNGIDLRGQFHGREILVKSQFEVKNADFIISKRQISHGAFGVLPNSLGGAIVSNEYAVFTAQDITDISFFDFYMRLPRHQNLFYLMSDGVHIEKMLFKTRDWVKQYISLPPLSEQQKIADILSAQERIIALKEELIAQKELRKKYLMGELLSGRKRLKGFDGQWEEKLLGELFTERTERNCASLSLLAITAKKGVVPRSEMDLKDNSSEDKSKYLKICVGDIGYNTMRMWQGVSAYSNYEGIVSPAYTILKPKAHIDAHYFSYLFKTPKIIFLFYRFSQGLVDDTRNLKYVNFKKIKVFIPVDKEAQTAIANILTTADREIDLLKQELEQEKQKKKALMQLLLTGIVRVTK